ncbi:glycosyltransferase family 2 protein [candidate division WWE3 bacterium]|nr:glycosyltransferase family 2 protein [candidate division WWE3 bacterium]
MKLDVSLVIPIYNEEKNIPLLYKEVKPVMGSSGKSYEIIMVDDGSQDGSWRELLRIAKEDSTIKILRHGRNMGLSQAYQNGFDHSSGEFILIMASDLENDSSDILRVIEKLEEGFDVVNTNRVQRWKNNKSSSLLRSVPSLVANRMISSITGVALKDTGSGLKGFKRYVVKNLKLYGEMHRFFVAYCSVFTKNITEIDVNYKDRLYGKSDYGSITRTFKVILDLFSLKFLFSMSVKPYRLMPGRLFGSVGIAMFGLGSLLSLYLVIEKLVFGQSIGDRPLLIFSVLFVVLGAQFIMTGFLGELLMRIYFESGGRKVYTVKETYNF